MSYYECKRCGHITKQKIEMIRHLNRKKKCLRVINSYNYNENEIEKASLIKHSYKQNNNNSQFIDLFNIDSNNNSEQNQFILHQPNSENNNITDIITTNNIDNHNIDNHNIDNHNIDNLNIDNHNIDNHNIDNHNFDNKHDNNITEDHNDNISDTISDHTSDCNDSNIIIIDNDFKNKLNKNINKKEENIFTCDVCLKIFNRKYNLTRHKKKCSIEKINTNFLKSSDNSDNNINNTTNNFNTINNNYNKNLFVNFNVEPFDNDWDVSRITKFTRHSILLSKIMYSNLLDNILQNEKNLNVVIEKDTNTGIVYKNNVDKFITMNMQDIIDKSMDKLNKHLKDFYNESMKDDEFIIMDKIFQEQIVNIENKYNEFKNNDEIKKKVEEFITQIYDKKKENAIKLYNNTLLKDNDENGY